MPPTQSISPALHGHGHACSGFGAGSWRRWALLWLRTRGLRRDQDKHRQKVLSPSTYPDPSSSGEAPMPDVVCQLGSPQQIFLPSFLQPPFEPTQAFVASIATKLHRCLPDSWWTTPNTLLLLPFPLKSSCPGPSQRGFNVQVNEEPCYSPVTTQLLPGEMSIGLLCHHLPLAGQGRAASLLSCRWQPMCCSTASPPTMGNMKPF